MRLHRALAEAIEAEFCEATRKLAAGDALHAFTHLERAHWTWAPEGNTGGTNIGAFEKLPVPPELRRLISPAGPQV